MYKYTRVVYKDSSHLLGFLFTLERSARGYLGALKWWIFWKEMKSQLTFEKYVSMSRSRSQKEQHNVLRDWQCNASKIGRLNAFLKPFIFQRPNSNAALINTYLSGFPGWDHRQAKCKCVYSEQMKICFSHNLTRDNYNNLNFIAIICQTLYEREKLTIVFTTYQA